MRKYYVTSVLVSFLTGGIIWACIGSHCNLSYGFFWVSHGVHIEPGPFYSLPGGFLAGLVGYWIDRKFATTLVHKNLLILLTIILSVLFSFFSLMCLWFLFDMVIRVNDMPI